MQYNKNFTLLLNKLKELWGKCKKHWNNRKEYYEWVKASPRNIAITVICSLAIIAGVAIFIRILPYLILAGIVIWAFSEEIKAFFLWLFIKFRLPNLENDGVCFAVTRLVHQSIIIGKPLDGVADTPSEVYDLYNANDYLDIYNDAIILNLRLTRKSQDKIPDCNFLKVKLQASINARVTAGHLLGRLWAIPLDSIVPLIKVAMLDYSDLYIHIGILLTNRIESVNAARISDIPAPSPVVDDVDPLFAKDGIGSADVETTTTETKTVQTTAVQTTVIPFLLDEEAFLTGHKRWLGINYSQSPHTLVCGRTGSGKSVCAKAQMARTVLLAPPQLQPVEIIVIDPKGDTDFDFLEGLDGFYRGEAAPAGLDYAFEAFRRRQGGENVGERDTSRNLKIVFIDEFASLINLIEDKKQKEAAQRKLSLLLMLSRSYGFSIQTATQVPSAQTLGNSGNREQYGQVVLLGDSGSETQQMLFDGDSREAIKKFGPIGGRGVGWCSINGGIAQPVRVPKIQDFNKLHAAIRRGVENRRI